jgi:hypothetical protein
MQNDSLALGGKMAAIHSGQTKRSVSKEKFDSNWDRVFKKKKEKALVTEVEKENNHCDICHDTKVAPDGFNACWNCKEEDENE